MEALEPEEDFDVKSDDVQAELEENDESRIFLPLSEDRAAMLSKVADNEPGQEVRTYFKAHCENMDKMGDLYIPMIIRDQFYYIRR